MGLPIKRIVLLGLAGLGGTALLVDRTVLSSATAATESLTGLVEQVQSAQTIAAALDSGDPMAIQGLLESLVNDEGADPNQVPAGLFGLAEMTLSAAQPNQGTPAQDASGAPLRGEPGAGAGLPRVSMVITTPNGGLAVVNGQPMREGQHAHGLRLVRVDEDAVLVDAGRGPQRVAIRP
jgi:hypothetical protein